jgi:hypothetical protein
VWEVPTLVIFLTEGRIRGGLVSEKCGNSVSGNGGSVDGTQDDENRSGMRANTCSRAAYVAAQSSGPDANYSVYS